MKFGSEVESLPSWQLQHLPGVGACVVRFTSMAALQEALQQLGGGVRGRFRVDPAAIAAYTKAAAKPAPAPVQDSSGSCVGGQPAAQVAAQPDQLLQAAAAQPAGQTQQAGLKRRPPPYQPPGGWTSVGRPVAARAVVAQGDPWDD